MLYFAITSLERGDCVINASYEEGALKPRVARKILDGVERRLMMLLESENGS